MVFEDFHWMKLWPPWQHCAWAKPSLPWAIEPGTGQAEFMASTGISTSSTLPTLWARPSNPPSFCSFLNGHPYLTESDLPSQWAAWWEGITSLPEFLGHLKNNLGVICALFPTSFCIALFSLSYRIFHFMSPVPCFSHPKSPNCLFIYSISSMLPTPMRRSRSRNRRWERTWLSEFGPRHSRIFSRSIPWF